MGWLADKELSFSSHVTQLSLCLLVALGDRRQPGLRGCPQEPHIGPQSQDWALFLKCLFERQREKFHVQARSPDSHSGEALKPEAWNPTHVSFLAAEAQVLRYSSRKLDQQLGLLQHRAHLWQAYSVHWVMH